MGRSPQDINMHVPVEDFADSITVMRFRNNLERLTGKVMTVEDVASHRTVESQIQLLSTRVVNASKQRTWPAPEGPPTPATMVHTCGDIRRANRTRRHVEDLVKPYGLTWEEDVESIVPAYDYGYMIFRALRPLSWAFR